MGLYTQFIGEILDVKAESEVLDARGNIDIEKVRPIIFTPCAGTYHGIGKKIQDAFTTREIKK